MSNKYLEKIAQSIQPRTGPVAREGEHVPGKGSKLPPSNKRFAKSLPVITLENKGGMPPNFKKSPFTTPIVDAKNATKRIAGKVWASPYSKVGVGAAAFLGGAYAVEKAFGDKDIDKVKLN